MGCQVGGAPNFETEVKNNILFNNGTVTFIVDESYINIPVKGIASQIKETTFNNELPNVGALKIYTAQEINLLEEKIEEMLNGEDPENGYGFIPGKYESVNQQVSDDNQKKLNSNLETIGIAEKTGVYTIADGVVYVNNIIAKPNELADLIQDRKKKLQENNSFIIFSQTSNDLKITEADKTLLEQQLQVLQGDLSIQQTNLTAEQNNLQSEQGQLNSGETSLKIAYINLGFSEDATKEDVELRQAGVIDKLINDLKIFSKPDDITQLSVVEKKKIYETNKESEEYKQLENWLNYQDLLIMIDGLEKIAINISNIQIKIGKIESNISNLEASIQATQENIEDKTAEILAYKLILDEHKKKYEEILKILNETIPAVLSVIDTGSNRTWNVVRTYKSNEIVSIRADKVYGAVYNDYAEYRTTVAANPGRVVVEKGDGSMLLADRRLQLGANIISDTFGFAIGKTASASTPIAVCGRVLAYPYEPIGFFKPGAAVCSGPNGTVSMMTRDEIREWPDAIIGYVSEIPTYETWGTDNIKVDGRLWIKVV